MQAVLHPSNNTTASSSPTSESSHSPRHTFTHLTYSRHHLIDIAMETIKIAETGQYTNLQGQTVHLKDDLDWAVEHSVHYEHEFDFNEALKKFDSERESDASSQYANVATMQYQSAGMSSSHQANSMICTSNHHHHSQQGPLDNVPLRFQRTSFLVVSASWLEAASELLSASSYGTSSEGNTYSGTSDNNSSNPSNNVRVGVLNSASGTTPGGRFLKGTVSQEDCLCRASLLYSCISQPKFQSEGRFYGKNRSLRYGSSNCVIFSPG